jgi:hypothetical protein
MNATLRSLEAEKQKAQEEINHLYQKRMKLQAFVRYFENINEGYLSITKFAQEKVHSFLSQNKLFLRVALQCLIELIASDPDRYGSLLRLARDNNSLNLDGTFLNQSHKQATSDCHSKEHSSFSFHVDRLDQSSIIQSEQKVDQGCQQSLSVNESLEILVQEAEKKLFDRLVYQLAPAITTILLLRMPRSRYLLPVVPANQKKSSFQYEQPSAPQK